MRKKSYIIKIKIKEKKSSLQVKYIHYKKSDNIEIIEISNLNSINDYDLVTAKIRELLASEAK